MESLQAVEMRLNTLTKRKENIVFIKFRGVPKLFGLR